MTMLSALSPTIRNYLDDFVVRARRAAVIRAAGLAVAAGIGWALLWCAADRVLQLPQGVRLGALIAGAALALALLFRPLLSLGRRVDWVDAAWEVERHNPELGQRLVTVTSRMLGAADYRGSDEILLRLAREVDAKLASNRGARRPPLRQVLAPWSVVALELLLVIGLLRIPGLGTTQLSVRFLLPLASLPPVTTTRLSVEPGDADVIQSRPLTVNVKADELGDSPVTLFLGDDSRDGSRVTMTPAGGGTYSFTIASVDRDLRYHVTGGDARTPDYAIRVLRKPAVSQFRMRYEYPAYTRLPPQTLTNTDGRVEAPAGTHALLTVLATEPLQSALLTIGKDKILMDRTGEAHSRQAELVVRADSRYELDLISTREVAGSGPSGTMYIRAVPDVPPQVRLVRGGDSLRLNPREVLPLWYEALDDYGIESLTISARVNAKPPTQAPVRIWGDPRRQQDVFNLDLGSLPLTIGDVVTITLAATDTAGHTVSSEPLHVLISPQSVDVDTYERISELRNAAQRAQALAAQLDEAARAQDDAEAQKDHQSASYLSASSRGDRAVTSAAQTAALLRQSLLRAITHSDSDRLSVALAAWVDSAERQGAAAEEAFRQSGAPAGMGNPARDKLRDALEQSRRLQSQLQAVQQGQQAATILADRENLRVSESKPALSDPNARDRLNQALQRVRDEIARDAREIGLDPGAGDLDAQLHGKVDAADQILKESGPVDFIAAARQWSQEMQRDPQQRLGLEGRLSAAAQAEAIRPDADLVRARDLELESRAASAIAASGRGGGRLATTQTLESFASDVESLARAGELQRQRDRVAKESDELKAARTAATKARQDLSRYAGDSSDAIASALATRASPAGAPADRQKEAEDLAMQASAAASAHDYRTAAALDKSMIRRLDARPRRETVGATRLSAPATDEAEPLITSDRVEHHRQGVQRELASAERIDNLGQTQDRIAGQTGDAEKQEELAGRQRTVAEEIARASKQALSDSNWVGAPNARDKAAALVLAAQEQLAAMPQALAEAQAAAAARRDAAARAASARQQAQGAAPEQREAANRATDQAGQNVKDAAVRLGRAAAPLAPGAAQALADEVEPFAPETSAARHALSDQLVPALGVLQPALAGDDPAATDRAASDARQAIESAQRELAAAQDALMKRDPLLAAKLFARAAAESLALRPPDLRRAKARQTDVSVALSRAWDQSIHRAAAERLAALPSLAAVVGPPAPATKVPGQPAQSAASFSAAREWGRLRAAEGPELHSSLHDTDPPGFEEALRLYFEALGKAQEGK